MRLFLIALLWKRPVHLAVIDLSNLFIGAKGKINVREAYDVITGRRHVDKTEIGRASCRERVYA
jgi:hypothetical protein